MSGASVSAASRVEGSARRIGTGRLTFALVFATLVVSVLSSLGAPLVGLVALEYEVEAATAQWILTLPYLVSAATLPLLGKLGDGRHRRATIMVALSAVVVGSVLAALPLGFTGLLVGRALHGLGLGITPLVLGAAADNLKGPQAARVVALLSVTAGAGLGVGYPAAGWLGDLGGVHAPYWVGGAFAAAALVLAFLWVPQHTGGRSSRVDVGTVMLFAIGMVGLVLGLGEGDRWGWWSFELAAILSSSAVSLTWFVVRSLRVDLPIVDLRLFRSLPVLLAHLAALLTTAGQFALFSAVTLYAQGPVQSDAGLGRSAFYASLLIAPFAVTNLAASWLSATALRRIPRELVLTGGAGLYGIAFTMLLWFRAEEGLLVVAASVAGCGMGLIFAAMPRLIMRVTSAERLSSAMAINQLLRSVGSSLGAAGGGAVIGAWTATGETFPQDDAYSLLALGGILTSSVLAVTSVAFWLHLRRAPEAFTGSGTG